MSNRSDPILGGSLPQLPESKKVLRCPPPPDFASVPAGDTTSNASVPLPVNSAPVAPTFAPPVLNKQNFQSVEMSSPLIEKKPWEMVDEKYDLLVSSDSPAVPLVPPSFKPPVLEIENNAKSLSGPMASENGGGSETSPSVQMDGFSDPTGPKVGPQLVAPPQFKPPVIGIEKESKVVKEDTYTVSQIASAPIIRKQAPKPPPETFVVDPKAASERSSLTDSPILRKKGRREIIFDTPAKLISNTDDGEKEKYAPHPVDKKFTHSKTVGNIDTGARPQSTPTRVVRAPPPIVSAGTAMHRLPGGITRTDVPVDLTPAPSEPQLSSGISPALQTNNEDMTAALQLSELDSMINEMSQSIAPGSAAGSNRKESGDFDGLGGGTSSPSSRGTPRGILSQPNTSRVSFDAPQMEHRVSFDQNSSINRASLDGSTTRTFSPANAHTRRSLDHSYYYQQQNQRYSMEGVQNSMPVQRVRSSVGDGEERKSHDGGYNNFSPPMTRNIQKLTKTKTLPPGRLSQMLQNAHDQDEVEAGTRKKEKKSQILEDVTVQDQITLLDSIMSDMKHRPDMQDTRKLVELEMIVGDMKNELTSEAHLAVASGMAAPNEEVSLKSHQVLRNRGMTVSEKLQNWGADMLIKFSDIGVNLNEVISSIADGDGESRPQGRRGRALATYIQDVSRNPPRRAPPKLPQNVARAMKKERAKKAKQDAKAQKNKDRDEEAFANRSARIMNPYKDAKNIKHWYIIKFSAQVAHRRGRAKDAGAIITPIGVAGFIVDPAQPEVIEPIISEVIVQRVAPRIIRSKKTLYVLEGDMDYDACMAQGFSAEIVEKFKQGFPDNWIGYLFPGLGPKST